jgi:hypothetical protein
MSDNVCVNDLGAIGTFEGSASVRSMPVCRGPSHECSSMDFASARNKAGIGCRKAVATAVTVAKFLAARATATKANPGG